MRFARQLAATLLALVFVTSTTTAALAVPSDGDPTDCAEVACSSIAGGPTQSAVAGQAIDLRFDLTVTGVPTDATTMRIQLAKSLIAAGSPVRVNDVPAAPDSVTASGADIAVDLVSAGVTTPGTFAVTVAVIVASHAEAGSSLTSTAVIDTDGQLTAAKSVTVDVSAPPAVQPEPQPLEAQPPVDLSLTDTYPELSPWSMGRGGSAVAVMLSGRSTSATSGVLRITVPAGFALIPNGVLSLSADAALICTHPTAQTYSCPTAVQTSGGYVLFVTADRATRVNSTANLVADLQPVDAVELNPADNRAVVALRAVGLSHLEYTIDPSAQPAEVAVDTSRKFTATVRNTGPDPAINVEVYPSLIKGIAEIGDPIYQDSHLQITGLGDFYYPNIGPGQSVSIEITVTARTAGGNYRLAVYGYATSSDPSPQCADQDCEYAVSTDLTLVDGPPPPPTPPPPPPTAGPSDPPANLPNPHGQDLAVTGAEIRALPATGVVMLVIGAALCWSTRRTRSAVIRARTRS